MQTPMAMAPVKRGTLRLARTGRAVTTRAAAFNTTKKVINLLDAAREELAEAYAGAPSHSEEERALRMILTHVCKAIDKAEEAGSELGQLELPFDAAVVTGDDDSDDRDN